MTIEQTMITDLGQLSAIAYLEYNEVIKKEDIIVGIWGQVLPFEFINADSK